MTPRKLVLALVSATILILAGLPAQSAIAVAPSQVVSHGTSFEPDGLLDHGKGSMISSAISASGDRIVTVSNADGATTCSSNQSDLVVRWGLVQQNSTTWDSTGLKLPGNGIDGCDYIYETRVVMSDDGTKIAVIWSMNNVSAITVATLQWGVNDAAPVLQEIRVFSSGLEQPRQFLMTMSADGSRFAASWVEGNNSTPVGHYAVFDFESLVSGTSRAFPGSGVAPVSYKISLSDDGEQVLFVTYKYGDGNSSQSQVVYTCSALCQPSKLKRFTLPAWTVSNDSGGDFSVDLNRQGTRLAISWSVWSASHPSLTKVVVVDPRTVQSGVNLAPLAKTSFSGSLGQLTFDSTGTRLAAINWGATKVTMWSARVSSQNLLTNQLNGLYPEAFAVGGQLVSVPASATTPERLALVSYVSSAQVFVSDSFASPKAWGLAGSVAGGGNGFGMLNCALQVSRNSGRLVFTGSYISIDISGWHQTAGVLVMGSKGVLVPSVSPKITGLATVSSGVTLSQGTWPAGSSVGVASWRTTDWMNPEVPIAPTGKTYRPTLSSEMGARVVIDFSVTKDGFYSTPVKFTSAPMSGLPIVPALSVSGAGGPGGAPGVGNTLAYSTTGTVPQWFGTAQVWKVGTRTVGTGDTLLVTQAMVGKVISLTVTYSNQNWKSSSKTLRLPAVVAAVG